MTSTNNDGRTKVSVSLSIRLLVCLPVSLLYLSTFLYVHLSV